MMERPKMLVLLLLSLFLFAAASPLDDLDGALAAPRDTCLNFGYICERDRDCCTDKKLECEERICICKENWIPNPVDGQCIKVPDFDDDDDTLVIVLSVVGGVILVAAIAGGAFFYMKKKKQRRSSHRRRAVEVSAPASAPAHAPPMSSAPNPAALGFVDDPRQQPQPAYFQPGPSSLPPPYSDNVHGKN